MACNPDCSAMLAAGSYLGDTGIFEENSGDLLYVLQGQRGGITQVGPHLAQQRFWTHVELVTEVKSVQPVGIEGPTQGKATH